jgi:hypothetical protein
MKKVIILVLAGLLVGSYAYAETVEIEYFDKDAHKYHNHDATRTTEVTVHDKTTDTSNKPESELGVGADVLIHETERADIVAEYKYDFQNESHSAYLVVKTKKSLVDYIKALLGKE